MTPPVNIGNALESLSNLVYLMQRETDLVKLREYLAMMDSAMRVLVHELGFAPPGALE